MNKYVWEGKVSFPFKKSKEENTFTAPKTGAQKLSFNVTCEKSFIDCQTWNKDYIAKLEEGMRVRVINYIPQKSSWTNGNTGAKSYSSFMLVNELVILEQAELKTDIVLEESNWELNLDEDKKPKEDKSLESMLEDLGELL